MCRLLSMVLVFLALGVTVPASAQAAAPVAPEASAVLAQGQGGGAARAGRNLGEIAKQWGGSLLLGIAGLMGLAALAKRNFGEGITLLGLVVLIGGFIFAGDAVKGFVESLWSAMAG